MKQKKTNNVLALNKVTVARLDMFEMGAVNGGCTTVTLDCGGSGTLLTTASPYQIPYKAEDTDTY